MGEAEADLLVCADGSRSQARHRLLPQAANVKTNVVRVHIDDDGRVSLRREEGLAGPSASLAFPEGYPFAGDEIIPTLKGLLELTTGVIEAFSKLVDG